MKNNIDTLKLVRPSFYHQNNGDLAVMEGMVNVLFENEFK